MTRRYEKTRSADEFGSRMERKLHRRRSAWALDSQILAMVCWAVDELGHHGESESERAQHSW
eukprot:10603706-Alexandrium_andersonii.AAC.1